jgi:hypothetical protein
LFISEKHIKKTRRKKDDMSEGDTFWVSLAERLFGLLLIVIGAIMLYFTATSSGSGALGGFSVLFGALCVILIILGIFMFLVKPPE